MFYIRGNQLRVVGKEGRGRREGEGGKVRMGGKRVVLGY